MGVTDAEAVLTGLGVAGDDAGVWLTAVVGEAPGGVGVPTSGVDVADGVETETAIGPVGAG